MQEAKLRPMRKRESGRVSSCDSCLWFLAQAPAFFFDGNQRRRFRLRISLLVGSVSLNCMSSVGSWWLGFLAAQELRFAQKRGVGFHRLRAPNVIVPADDFFLAADDPIAGPGRVRDRTQRAQSFVGGPFRVGR